MNIQQQVIHYCAAIGADPMLIQGAGGNASWKEGTVMWIKASGTWLADAVKKDIFVPIDIARTLALIAEGAVDLSSARIGQSPLRPSIETCLHALLPQRFVVHFHAVDVIAHAIIKEAKQDLQKRLCGLDWAWIDYVKPGPDLAHAVTSTIGTGKAPDILVLGNHGLVVAADSLQQLDALLLVVLERCSTTPRVVPLPTDAALSTLSAQWKSLGYTLPSEARCHALALDAHCMQLAASAWVLYPDHAVFLGARATFADCPWNFRPDDATLPECVIIPGHGVLARHDLSPGQLSMLTCYADVAVRLDNPEEAVPLNQEQIGDLLNWDAEKYRQSLNAI